MDPWSKFLDDQRSALEVFVRDDPAPFQVPQTILDPGPAPTTHRRPPCPSTTTVSTPSPSIATAR